MNQSYALLRLCLHLHSEPWIEKSGILLDSTLFLQQFQQSGHSGTHTTWHWSIRCRRPKTEIQHTLAHTHTHTHTHTMNSMIWLDRRAKHMQGYLLDQ